MFKKWSLVMFVFIDPPDLSPFPDSGKAEDNPEEKSSLAELFYYNQASGTKAGSMFCPDMKYEWRNIK